MREAIQGGAVFGAACSKAAGYDSMPRYLGPQVGYTYTPGSEPNPDRQGGGFAMESIPIIPRAEDLPYWTSSPIQFVYESVAHLVAGTYTWADVPSPLTPTRPILQNALYYFRSISLVADTTEFDFSTNVVTPPAFYMFKIGDQNTMLFREPVLMNKFYDQFDFRLFWLTSRVADQVQAAFVGRLTQGAGLIGKANITLKAIVSAQEITDKGYIDAFRCNYPVSHQSSGEAAA